MNALRFDRPKCWGKWAKDFGPVGHAHLDALEPPKKKRGNLTTEERRRVGSLGGTARGKNPTSVRLGFGGHRHIQEELDRKALEEGRKIVAVMVKRGIVEKEDAGNEALAYAVGVVRGDTVPVGTRLQAAKLVLEFTMAKPAAKTDVKLTVEDFLEDLAAEARKEASED